MTIAQLRDVVNSSLLDGADDFQVYTTAGLPMQITLVTLNGMDRRVSFQVTANPIRTAPVDAPPLPPISDAFRKMEGER